jgi:hypothetical protein
MRRSACRAAICTSQQVNPGVEHGGRHALATAELTATPSSATWQIAAAGGPTSQRRSRAVAQAPHLGFAAAPFNGRRAKPPLTSDSRLRESGSESTELEGSASPPPATAKEPKILGLDLGVFAASLAEIHDTPFVLIRADASQCEQWAELLGVPARRCYISDARLAARASEAKVDASEIAAAMIPDPGSVMSGDFGEILAAFYLAARSLPAVAIDPLRWRYKADRRKSAPYSDVVQILLPTWPQASPQDRILCAEVKAKATSSSFDPIEAARTGSALDRRGRLVNTLQWLKDKALTDGSDTIEVAQLSRFIQAIDYPAATWEFCAVAVIDASLVDDEVAKMSTDDDAAECTLIVISVPELKRRYTELFAEILACTSQHPPVFTGTANTASAAHQNATGTNP